MRVVRAPSASRHFLPPVLAKPIYSVRHSRDDHFIQIAIRYQHAFHWDTYRMFCDFVCLENLQALVGPKPSWEKHPLTPVDLMCMFLYGAVQSFGLITAVTLKLHGISSFKKLGMIVGHLAESGVFQLQESDDFSDFERMDGKINLQALLQTESLVMEITGSLGNEDLTANYLFVVAGERIPVLTYLSDLRQMPLK